MKIYLVRHGEADITPEKGLSPKGREDVWKIARFLGENSFPLGLIMHSDRARARETAQIMGEHIAPGLRTEEMEGLGPEDPIERGFHRMEAEDGGCMLVGHLPFLNKFVGRAVCGDEELVLVNFKPGTTVCLESSGGGWVIDWVVGIEQV